MMNKKSALLKNTAIIGIGSLSTKVLTFFLLPLYTAVLATEDYGITDVLMTVSSLMIPFVTLEMNSGVFRFIIGRDSHDEKKAVISTAAITEICGLICCSVIVGIIYCFYQIQYIVVFLLYLVSVAFIRLTSDTIRGFGNNTVYALSNFIVTLISLLLNLLFILVLQMKGESILLAAAIGNFCGAAMIVVKGHLWKYISIKAVDQAVFHSLAQYTLPLVPNTVSWWVVSASDRLIILTFLGVSANGIYAAANKIPGIYTTIFSVYSLAWTEAIARNADDKLFISDTFRKSINVMIYMLLGIMICSSLFFKALIGSNYSDSYWHIFILLLAIFFSSASSLLGGIFAGKMESKNVAQTTLLGAVVNIILNFVLVRYIGLYAASISTLAAYFTVFVIRLKCCRKWYALVLFSKKDIVIVFLTAAIMMGYYIRSNWVSVILILMIMIVFAVNHKDEFIRITYLVKGKVKRG